MTETRAPRTTPETALPPHPATVLVVDDDQSILDGVGEFLRAEGFKVVPAANGAEALARLRLGLSADVILLDVMMPIMDGWDFRAEQLADPALRDIPVIVISASGFARETIATQLKTREVLAKPLELVHFLKAIRDVCGRGDSDQGSSVTGS